MTESIQSLLLVDDDYATNRYNKIILEDAGLTSLIWEANNGAQALKILKSISQHLPNVILLDINMPVVNGWEFLDALEELDYHNLRDTAIYILSASKNPDDKDKAQQYTKVKGFISKPLVVDEVKHKLLGIA